MKLPSLLRSSIVLLVVIAAPAVAAPSFDARLINKGLLISSSGGAANNCTLSVDVSQLVNGVRVTQHLSFQGVQPALKAGPVVLQKMPTMIDLRIEAPVTATCT